MKKKETIIAISTLIICLGCMEQQETQKKIIVVTIPPQQEFVEKIAGDKVKVIVMVPPGASPHTYEPTPTQMADVSKADMYAQVGSGLEFETTWFDKIKETNNKMLVVNCSRGIKPIPTGDIDEYGRPDPHVWLSPKNAQVMVENIYAGLIQLNPENREYYKTKKKEYINELEALDKEIEAKLSKKENKKIMVYHPAWTYFMEEYGFQQIPIEKEGKEPTPRGIASLISQAREDNITVIFASPQFSTKSAKTIADEINAEVILLDPLAKDYVGNLGKIAGEIAAQ